MVSIINYVKLRTSQSLTKVEQGVSMDSKIFRAGLMGACLICFFVFAATSIMRGNYGGGAVALSASIITALVLVFVISGSKWSKNFMNYAINISMAIALLFSVFASYIGLN